MKTLILIYFTISITSIFRDFVDSQYDLRFDEALIMLFILPPVLIYSVIEEIHNKLTVKEKESE